MSATTSDTTDASGNRRISTASGGFVGIPSSQPQTPPTGSLAGTSGIVDHGVAQVKGNDGTFRDATLPASSAVDNANSDPDQQRAAGTAGPGGWMQDFAKRKGMTA